MADFTFHVGDQSAPIQIVHHVGADMPEDDKWHEVQELLTRRMSIDGEEGLEVSIYVTYKMKKTKEIQAFDDLTVGYTNESNPRVNLEHRRLEVV